MVHADTEQAETVIGHPVAEKAGPHYGTYKELPEGQRYCTHCERDLSGHAFRWLELDQRTQTYHDFQDVPADRSQGWFPFGLTCAKKLVKAEQKRRARPNIDRTDDAANAEVA